MAIWCLVFALLKISKSRIYNVSSTTFLGAILFAWVYVTNTNGGLFFYNLDFWMISLFQKILYLGDKYF